MVLLSELFGAAATASAIDDGNAHGPRRRRVRGVRDAHEAAARACAREGGDEASPVGHGWSGGSKDSSNPVAAIPSTESATELGRSFFKRYAW